MSPRPDLTLGKEIKRLRTEAKVTLRKFADNVGISAAHESDIEHDRRRPSPEVLVRIARELRSVGATFEELDRLSTRLEPDIQEWIAETPVARHMLRAVRESGHDPQEVLREIERFLKKQRENQ